MTEDKGRHRALSPVVDTVEPGMELVPVAVILRRNGQDDPYPSRRQMLRWIGADWRRCWKNVSWMVVMPRPRAPTSETMVEAPR